MVMKVLFLTFCMGIGICMGTEPPSEPFQGTFETHIKGWCEPVRLILHGRGTFEYYSEYGGLSYKGCLLYTSDAADD